MKKLFTFLFIFLSATKLNYCTQPIHRIFQPIKNNQRRLRTHLKYVVGAQGKKPLTRAQNNLMIQLTRELARDPETMEVFLDAMQRDPARTKSLTVEFFTGNH